MYLAFGMRPSRGQASSDVSVNVTRFSEDGNCKTFQYTRYKRPYMRPKPEFVLKVELLYLKFLENINMIAERGFDPRTSGLWAQHASTAPLCSC